MEDEKKISRVLVASPVSDHHAYCYEEYRDALKALTYPHHDIFLVDNSKDNTFFKRIAQDFPSTKIPYVESVKDRLTISRNILREKAIKEGYDYLFCLDQDTIPPHDIIEKLLSHHKEIVSGLYLNPFTRNNETKIKPVAWVYTRDDSTKLVFVREEVLHSGQCVPVNLVGTGCILIHRDVLEKITFRTEPDKTGVDDNFFCIDVQKLGYTIWLDTSARCKHLLRNTQKWGMRDLKT
jgi:GT2 family glycosyltransferase